MKQLFLLYGLLVNFQICQSMKPSSKPPIIIEKKLEYKDLLELVEHRIKNHENLNSPIKNKTSSNSLNCPLIQASQDDKYLTITKLLLKNGANPDIQNDQLSTPLHYSVKRGAVQTTKLLLQYNANPNVKNLQCVTPLHFICSYSFSVHNEEQINNRINILTQLLAAKADPNIGDKYGSTCLHKLIGYSYFAFLRPAFGLEEKKRILRDQRRLVIKKIIQAGGSLNKVNKEGQTPTQIVCKDSYYYDDAKKDCEELSAYARGEVRYRLVVDLLKHSSPFRFFPKDLVKMIVYYVYPYRKNRSTS